MSATPLPYITEEQYLALDREAEIRSEYFNGVMYAMSGGSLGHGIIINNTGTQFNLALADRACTVYSSNVRIRVSSKGLYTYPDLAVVCGAAQVADNQKDTLLNPIVIVEALSKSTEGYDRGWKFAQYRKIPSFQEYVLISQVDPVVEIFRRQPDDTWRLTTYEGLDQVAELESIDCRIPLSGIYAKVEFPSNPHP